MVGDCKEEAEKLLPPNNTNFHHSLLKGLNVDAELLSQCHTHYITEVPNRFHINGPLNLLIPQGNENDNGNGSVQDQCRQIITAHGKGTNWYISDLNSRYHLLMSGILITRPISLDNTRDMKGITQRMIYYGAENTADRKGVQRQISNVNSLHHTLEQNFKMSCHYYMDLGHLAVIKFKIKVLVNNGILIEGNIYCCQISARLISKLYFVCMTNNGENGMVLCEIPKPKSLTSM